MFLNTFHLSVRTSTAFALMQTSPEPNIQVTLFEPGTACMIPSNPYIGTVRAGRSHALECITDTTTGHGDP